PKQSRILCSIFPRLAFMPLASLPPKLPHSYGLDANKQSASRFCSGLNGTRSAKRPNPETNGVKN
ncbi:MAG: hypothetical protein VW757_09955, partial [Halieaceae bacterium]